MKKQKQQKQQNPTEEILTFTLSKEESLRLKNNALLQHNLQLQFDKAQMELVQIADDFCKRVGQKRENIVDINTDEGVVKFRVESKRNDKKDAV